ncbi:MAG: L,D-transpeptidase family protein [Eubacteriales bacterium]|nr:L,D-transpeptidase family protein [Eubacteriales bacterium]
MKFRWNSLGWFDPWGHAGALSHALCRLTALFLAAGLIVGGAPVFIRAASPAQMAVTLPPAPVPDTTQVASPTPARTYAPFTAAPGTAPPATAAPTATAPDGTPAPSQTPSASLTPTPQPGPTPTPVYTGRYVLVVYKGSQVVVAYAADDAGNYDASKPLRKMICSTGASGSETPSGSFSISNKYVYRKLEGAYGQYASRFYGGCLFHSVPIATSATTIDAGRSMMSVAGYNSLGRKASHGCIRMLVRDAKWIYSSCPSGTKVIVTGDSSPVGGGSKPALIQKSPYVSGGRGWDPTDPHPSNPYNNNVLFVQSVQLDKSALTVTAGSTATLRATVLPANAYDISVTWLSSQNGVATVADGVITGVAPGQTVITVITQDGGWNAACIVTVVEPTPAPTLDPTLAPTLAPTAPVATPTAAPTVPPPPTEPPPATLPPEPPA